MSVLLIDLDTLKAQIAARLNRLVQLNPSCTWLLSSRAWLTNMPTQQTGPGSFHSRPMPAPTPAAARVQGGA